ncbi:acidic mammalian chitinase-like [Bicyclus anynana]|uniref:Acidic mammalian chitinase-like n=1 Tax=Bicyclus anynana TaxID=110368 RepID=A0A6J1MKK7_BICAN|nr:acidic mammalian chitinase-like [Bicyclus anynana]
MYKLLLLAFCAFVFSVTYGAANEKRVICYYGSWATYRNSLGKFDVSDINAGLCTHLVYTFLGINTKGAVISLDPYLDYADNWGKDNLRKFNALKQQNPELKTLIAVGGWIEGSAKYSLMTAKPALRKNFIDTALEMVRKYNFDGLDIDWEYPNRYDSVYGPADVNNFSVLLKELREEFDKYGLLLTAAVSSVKKVASQSYDIPVISQYLDFINVMAYDMYVATNPVTGHNAPLHKSAHDEDVPIEDLYTVDGVLEYWLSQGCPSEKLVLGVPLYGHTFKLTNAKDNGVKAPSNGPGIAGPYTATNGVIGYNELCQKFGKESWNLLYDDSAKVPYAVQNDNWVSYDDADSLTEKVQYALKYNVTGVMVWSIETDDFRAICQDEDYPLLRAINNALGRDVVAPSTTPAHPQIPATTVSTIICKEDGFQANPEDCSSFYYCIRDANGNLVAKLLHCPANLVWDQTNQICNYPDQVIC